MPAKSPIFVVKNTKNKAEELMIYPIGIQNFESLRRDGYVYVDKTQHIHRLATTGRYYFLSRPRRFGKSLLISTMDAYFRGKRELFQGLAIDRLDDKEWVERPVLRLDLNTAKYESKESLDRVLEETLDQWEALYGKSKPGYPPEMRFLGVVERAAKKTGHRVVILVDEYDKPLLQALGNEPLMDEYRRTLKAFYSVLKTQDEYIKFGFLTGVTKFSKVSIFSDLNNLKDISMDRRYADICGISEEELHQYFEPSVVELAEANNLTKTQCYDKLKIKFNGYHFEVGTVGVYNPFSLLNTFESKTFRDYWFESGTPTFLVELMKRTNYDLRRLQTEQVTSDVLNSIDTMTYNPIPVLYQSGYLTIKGLDEEFGLYHLGFPNEEVERGFVKFLLPCYTPLDSNSGSFFVANFVRDVREGNVEGFMERLQTMFDDRSTFGRLQGKNDYRVAGKLELYFQNMMYVIFKMMGFYTEVERATSKGRIDVTIKTHDYIYIIEIKLDGTAEEALKQIEEKGYAKPFAQDPRQLFKLGINFDSTSRTINEWLMG